MVTGDGVTRAAGSAWTEDIVAHAGTESLSQQSAAFITECPSIDWQQHGIAAKDRLVVSRIRNANAHAERRARWSDLLAFTLFSLVSVEIVIAARLSLLMHLSQLSIKSVWLVWHGFSNSCCVDTDKRHDRLPHSRPGRQVAVHLPRCSCGQNSLLIRLRGRAASGDTRVRRPNIGYP